MVHWRYYKAIKVLFLPSFYRQCISLKETRIAVKRILEKILSKTLFPFIIILFLLVVVCCRRQLVRRIFNMPSHAILPQRCQPIQFDRAIDLMIGNASLISFSPGTALPSIPFPAMFIASIVSSSTDPTVLLDFLVLH